MKRNFFLTILFIFLISIISIAQDTGKKHLRNSETRVVDNKENSLRISVPRTLNYQGFLTDSDGTNLNDTYQIKFRIFNLLTGGVACYDQLYSVSVEEGHFNQVLENVVDCNFEQTTWLQIDVDGEELSPRQEITSAASSLTSDQVDGFDANSTATAGTLYPLGSDAKFSTAVIPEVPPLSHSTTHNEGGQDVISVTSSVIVDLAIIGDDIDNSTIPIGKLDFTPAVRPLSPGVSTTEIANNAVTSSKIMDLTITSADIANSTIPIGKLNFTPVVRPLSPGVSTTEIADNAVSTAKIQDFAVTQLKIDPSVTLPIQRPISPPISTSEIADGAVTSGKINVPLSFSVSNTNPLLSITNSSGIGGRFESNALQGIRAFATLGVNSAVWGTTTGSNGTGFRGVADNGSLAYGVWGQSASGRGGPV